MEPEVHKKTLRFYEIDLLRFIAALSVVLFHYTYRGYAADNFSPIPFLEIGRFTRYGYLGVHLFFVVSGYVILLSVQGKRLQQFFKSRFTRLYPAFWVAVTLTFLVKVIWGTTASDTQMSFYLHAGLRQYVFSMTMFQDFFGINAIDQVYGTLTVELTFYFLISLLMGYRLLRHLDLFLTFWLGICLLPLTRIADLGPAFSTLFLPTNAPLFAAGMLFFLMQDSKGRSWLRYGLLLAFYLLALRAASEQIKWLNSHYHDNFSPLIIWGVITAIFAVFFLITRRIFILKYNWLSTLGGLTYPLYLIHSDIGFIAFFRLGHLFNKYVLLSSTIVFMLSVAYLLHRFVEKPISKLLGKQVDKLSAYLGTAY